IHQIEGHIVVPNVMGSALRLHPLLIIFGLLAGAEIYGLPGIFVALPVLAAGRAAWEFFGERVELEPWQGGGPVPVEVDVEPPARSSRARAVSRRGRGSRSGGCRSGRRTTRASRHARTSSSSRVSSTRRTRGRPQSASSPSSSCLRTGAPRPPYRSVTASGST